MSKKISKVAAKKAVSEYLDLDHEIKRLTAEKKEAKTVIEEYAEQNENEFVDNKLKVGQGLVKQVNGSPSLVDEFGNAIADNDITRLIGALSNRYIQVKPDITRINKTFCRTQNCKKY